MNESQSLWNILSHGGGTVVLLALLSLYTIYAIVDRSLRLRRASSWDSAAWEQALSLLDSGKNRELSSLLEASEESLWARLLRAAQTKASEKRRSLRAELESCLDSVEGPLVVLATIGATAPFIGLFGTVLGIMRVFRDMGASGGGGIVVVGPGISAALIATAAGIFVAIPAVAGYNLLGKSAERLRARGESLISRILGDA